MEQEISPVTEAESLGLGVRGQLGRSTGETFWYDREMFGILIVKSAVCVHRFYQNSLKCTYLKNRGFVYLFVCFLKNRLFLKIFPSLSVCHTLVPAHSPLEDVGDFLPLARAGKRVPRPAYSATTKQTKADGFTIQVILGDRTRGQNCIMWKLGGTILTLDLLSPGLTLKKCAKAGVYFYWKSLSHI